jgi:putative ABC transport system ATP-binding protein
MLNVLGCLDNPTSGRYLLDSKEVAGLNDSELSRIRLRRFGFVFQSFNLIPQLSVQENIALPLFYLGTESRQGSDKAAELAGLVGLSDRLRHRPAELSGGQQQRVAIARALANDPTVILADEPTGNLDTASGRQIMELLADLNGQGKTVIVVTHERDIATYASHRISMRDGRIADVREGD